MLNQENLAQYLLAQTNLFSETEPITITCLTGETNPEIEGYLNYLYAVEQGKQHYIVKHATATVASDLNQTLGAVDPNRNYLEFITYQLRSGIIENMLPKVYHVDQKNHLFIMEDLSQMEIVRFFLNKGKQSEVLGKAVGEFLAKSHYYTSLFALPNEKFNDLKHYFKNQDLRRILIDFIIAPAILTKETSTLPVLSTPYQKALLDILENFFAKNNVRKDWDYLRNLAAEKAECLIHGDFHTSNLFINTNGIRVIDMEYTMTGPFSYDLGYFTANLIAQYASFSVNQKVKGTIQASMTSYLLQMIKDIFNTYFTYFESYYLQQHPDEKHYFKPLFVTILQEALGFLAMANLSRISGFGAFPDFDHLSSDKEQFLAKALSIKICETLFEERQHIKTIDEAIILIEKNQQAFLADLLAA
ncbi:5-methylthioribose kinase [Enterococcus sp. PF1-24]|uniref:phosphotransferase n=1 Tax=unclassified Enterococcus TaxID=2608891 RepID=UPI0024748B3C|nr:MULTISPECIES: phosphotransferase [unclassified Enterococcus]MDH6365603.1 5-methylthioribose kinase [Enterococcus sp. PFB1-1]MDH6402705.1 5-methylthioribose kinase [Enterococcus sp. PF1-24]